MEGAISLALLVGLGILAGSVFGWITFFQLIELRKHIKRLQQEFDKLTQTHPTRQTQDTRAQPKSTMPPPPAPGMSKPPAPRSGSTITAPPKSPATQVAATKTAPPTPLWLQHLKANWMIWLGGASVGLSGIFLVKYSIDAGLLGPTARVSLAILTGLTFHAIAFWLKQRNTDDAADVFAALAGGASIMIYAALLAAVHLYTLWPPGLVFTLLAAASMFTMALALLHGPVLAAIGILGAYAVPILVNTGSNNITGALIYAAIISFSAFWLMRYVYRSWLWMGTLAGALVWWVIALSSTVDIGTQLLYLFFLTYGLLAVGHKNWLLNQSMRVTEQLTPLTLFNDKTRITERRLFAAVIALLAAHLLTLVLNETGRFSLLFGLLMPAMLLWYCRYQPLYALVGWISFAALASGLLARGLVESMLHYPLDNNTPLIAMLAITPLLYTATSLWILRQHRINSGLWVSLASLSPIVCLAIAYIRITALSTNWQWAVAALALGASYLHILHRQRRLSPSPAVIASLTVAAHLAYSLAVIMVFREATLTLALAAQVITLVWLEKTYSLPLLAWVIKGLLGVVIARITLNPWLLTYPTDQHWSLWVCGGSFVATAIATWLARERHKLQPWLQGATLHLLALTLIFEVRYQLYDGHIFADTYTFLEAAINTSVWGLLGNVYLYRARTSEHLGRFYTRCGSLLLTLSIANYGWILMLLKNPLWSPDNISATPIFNLLLLAYGMPVLLAILAYWLSTERFRKLIGAITAVMLWYFVSIEIRHLWHGTLNTYSAASNGEHYSYSMAWLVLAVIGSVIGIRFEKHLLYKGAMAFLMCVVAKIFLFDMSGLTGLWRVGSFMALGISLLGLSWLHRRIRRHYVK